MRARWFDGHSSQARPVLVHLAGAGRGRASLRLHALDAPGGAPLQLAPGQFEWPDTWEGGRASPRLTIDLREHGSLEVDGQLWQQALADCGARTGMAQRLQASWPWILAALAATAALVWAFARWGTPWAAEQLARHAPLEWEQRLSQEALAQLEEQGVLKPSRLAPARQDELQAAFKALAAQIPPALRTDAGYSPAFELHFRSGMGPNALALPGGTMVLTDAMVELASREALGDEALMGVLAHEAGHVLYRHGTRRLIEFGLLNAGLALALGDVSGIVSTGGMLLTTLAYSRDHERAADCFAVALMKETGRPLAPMADLLLAAERTQSGKSLPMGDWLRTHPDTAGRAQAIKTGQAGAECRLVRRPS